MRITIETIRHENQRYPSAGDWIFLGDTELRIFVSYMGDWKKEFLVAVHELVEAALCRSRGISEEAVTEFDKAFELGMWRDISDPGDSHRAEPGDHPSAPYKREHCTATGIERLLAAELDVDWFSYDSAVEALPCN